MPQTESHRPSDFGRTLKRSHLRAFYRVTVGWVLGLALLYCLMLAYQQQEALSDALIIAVSSGIIACLSMLPALFQGWRDEPGQRLSESNHPWQRFTVCLLAGMMIRVTGTVALFLTCRYHMSASTELIAGMTIGWYVLLTSLEVSALARELPKTAKAPNFAETSLG